MNKQTYAQIKRVSWIDFTRTIKAADARLSWMPTRN